MKNIVRFILSLSFIFFSNAWAENAELIVEPSKNQIREFILENPEVILESLKRYELKMKSIAEMKEKELIKKELMFLKSNKFDYVGGNPDGSITMIEFLDYKCGFCRRAHHEIQQLLKVNPEIKFVVKELPILGDQSLIAAKASLAVLLNQGNAMYEAFTAKLVEYDGIINQKSISTLVESIGGDLETIQSVMESSKIYDILDSNYALARKLNITGTPTFIIGTEIIRGYKDIKTLQQIINHKKQTL